MVFFISGFFVLCFLFVFVLMYDILIKINVVATMNDLKCFGSALFVVRRVAFFVIVNF